MISRRIFGKSLGLMTVAVTGLSFSSLGFAADPTIRVGVDPYTTGAQIWVSKEKGLFAKYGINVEVTTFATGIESLDAALTGRVDVGVGLDFPTALRAPSGQLRILAATFGSTPGFHKLAVADSIKSVADLKGKSFGVATGTAQDLVTNQYLVKKGVAAGEATIVPFGSQVEIIASLKAKRIDGAFVWLDGISQATSTPGFRIMADDSEAQLNQSGYVSANKAFAEKNRPALVAMLKMFAEATAFISANPEEATKMIVKNTNGPYEANLASVKATTWKLQITDTEKQSFATISEFASRITKQPISFDSAVDPSFLKEAVPAAVTLK